MQSCKCEGESHSGQRETYTKKVSRFQPVKWSLRGKGMCQKGRLQRQKGDKAEAFNVRMPGGNRKSSKDANQEDEE